jgi:hypothetical protein
VGSGGDIFERDRAAVNEWSGVKRMALGGEWKNIFKRDTGAIES